MSTNIPPSDESPQAEEAYFAAEAVEGERLAPVHAGSPSRPDRQLAFLIGGSVAVLALSIVISSIVLAVGANIAASQLTIRFERNVELRHRVDGIPSSHFPSNLSLSWPRELEVKHDFPNSRVPARVELSLPGQVQMKHSGTLDVPSTRQ